MSVGGVWAAMLAPAKGGDAGFEVDASVVLSCFAFLVSLGGLLTARRSLKISQRQELRKLPSVNLTIFKNVSWRERPGGERALAFDLQVTNPSEAATSLTTADLHLRYTVEGSPVVLKLAAHHGGLPAFVPSDGTTMAIPAPLAAGASIRGWLYFLVPEGALGGKSPDGYELFLETAHGIVASANPTLFQEGLGVEDP